MMDSYTYGGDSGVIIVSDEEDTEKMVLADYYQMPQAGYNPGYNDGYGQHGDSSYGLSAPNNAQDFNWTPDSKPRKSILKKSGQQHSSEGGMEKGQEDNHQIVDMDCNSDEENSQGWEQVGQDASAPGTINYCEPCKLYVNEGEWGYRRHCQTTSHQKCVAERKTRVAKIKDSKLTVPKVSTEKEYWYCMVCHDQCVAHPASWGVHVLGAKHVQNVLSKKAEIGNEAFDKTYGNCRQIVQAGGTADKETSVQRPEQGYRPSEEQTSRTPGQSQVTTGTSLEGTNPAQGYMPAIFQKIYSGPGESLLPTPKRKHPYSGPGVKPMEEQPFQCKLCNIACTGQSTWEMHLKGTKHNKSLQRMKARGFVTEEQMNIPSLQSPAMQAPRQQNPMHGYNQSFGYSHGGFQHGSNFPQGQVEMLPYPTEPWKEGPMHVSPSPKEQHKGTERNAAQETMLKGLLKGLFCTVCKVKLETYTDFRNHLQSSEHTLKQMREEYRMGKDAFQRKHGKLKYIMTEEDILQHAVEVKQKIDGGEIDTTPESRSGLRDERSSLGTREENNRKAQRQMRPQHRGVDNRNDNNRRPDYGSRRRQMGDDSDEWGSRRGRPGNQNKNRQGEVKKGIGAGGIVGRPERRSGSLDERSSYGTREEDNRKTQRQMRQQYRGVDNRDENSRRPDYGSRRRHMGDDSDEWESKRGRPGNQNKNREGRFTGRNLQAGRAGGDGWSAELGRYREDQLERRRDRKYDSSTRQGQNTNADGDPFPGDVLEPNPQRADQDIYWTKTSNGRQPQKAQNQRVAFSGKSEEGARNSALGNRSDLRQTGAGRSTWKLGDVSSEAQQTDTEHIPEVVNPPPLQDGKFSCFLCGIGVHILYSPRTWIFHLAGKRHVQSLLQKKREIGVEAVRERYPGMLPTAEMISYTKKQKYQIKKQHTKVLKMLEDLENSFALKDYQEDDRRSKNSKFEAQSLLRDGSTHAQKQNNAPGGREAYRTMPRGVAEQSPGIPEGMISITCRLCEDIHPEKGPFWGSSFTDHLFNKLHIQSIRGKKAEIGLASLKKEYGDLLPTAEMIADARIRAKDVKHQLLRTDITRGCNALARDLCLVEHLLFSWLRVDNDPVFEEYIPYLGEMAKEMEPYASQAKDNRKTKFYCRLCKEESKETIHAYTCHIMTERHIKKLQDLRQHMRDGSYIKSFESLIPRGAMIEHMKINAKMNNDLVHKKWMLYVNILLELHQAMDSQQTTSGNTLYKAPEIQQYRTLSKPDQYGTRREDIYAHSTRGSNQYEQYRTRDQGKQTEQEGIQEAKKVHFGQQSSLPDNKGNKCNCRLCGAEFEYSPQNWINHVTDEKHMTNIRKMRQGIGDVAFLEAYQDLIPSKAMIEYKKMEAQDTLGYAGDNELKALEALEREVKPLLGRKTEESPNGTQNRGFGGLPNIVTQNAGFGGSQAGDTRKQGGTEATVTKDTMEFCKVCEIKVAVSPLAWYRHVLSKNHIKLERAARADIGDAEFKKVYGDCRANVGDSTGQQRPSEIQRQSMSNKVNSIQGMEEQKETPEVDRLRSRHPERYYREHRRWQWQRTHNGLSRGSWVEFDNWMEEKLKQETVEYQDRKQQEERRARVEKDNKDTYQQDRGRETEEQRLQEMGFGPVYQALQQMRQVELDEETYKAVIEKLRRDMAEMAGTAGRANVEYLEWQLQRQKDNLPIGTIDEFEDWQMQKEAGWMEEQLRWEKDEYAQRRAEMETEKRDQSDWGKDFDIVYAALHKLKEIQFDEEMYTVLTDHLRKELSVGQQGDETPGTLEYLEWQLQRMQRDLPIGTVDEFQNWQMKREERPRQGHGEGDFSDHQTRKLEPMEQQEYEDWQRLQEAEGYPRGTFKEFIDWDRDRQQDREYIDWQKSREELGLERGTVMEYDIWQKRLLAHTEFQEWKAGRQRQGLDPGTYAEYEEWQAQDQLDNTMDHQNTGMLAGNAAAPVNLHGQGEVNQDPMQDSEAGGLTNRQQEILEEAKALLGVENPITFLADITDMLSGQDEPIAPPASSDQVTMSNVAQLLTPEVTQMLADNGIDTGDLMQLLESGGLEALAGMLQLGEDPFGSGHNYREFQGDDPHMGDMDLEHDIHPRAGHSDVGPSMRGYPSQSSTEYSDRSQHGGPYGRGNTSVAGKNFGRKRTRRRARKK